MPEVAKVKIIRYLVGIILFLVILLIMLYSKLERIEAELKLMEYNYQETFIFSGV